MEQLVDAVAAVGAHHTVAPASRVLLYHITHVPGQENNVYLSAQINVGTFFHSAGCPLRQLDNRLNMQPDLFITGQNISFSWIGCIFLSVVDPE